jgi:hypothetical protein
MWIWQLRQVVVRSLGALLECADGFWQLPNILEQLIALFNKILPLMAPNHIELFFRYVVTGGLFA